MTMQLKLPVNYDVIRLAGLFKSRSEIKRVSIQ